MSRFFILSYTSMILEAGDDYDPDNDGYARLQDKADRGGGAWAATEVTEQGAPLEAPAPAYTREDVSAALNRAADELGEHEYESEDSIRDDDRANLMVTLALGWLEHPEASADEVINAGYEGAADAETVRGWIA